MSSCQRAKPFTGLVFWFPPVVGLTPDPAAFSLRAPGSLSLARLHMRCAGPRSAPGSGLHCSPKTSGVGRTRVQPSLVPTRGARLGHSRHRQRGGTGSTYPSLQGRDCLSASRFRREHCSSLLPQGRRAARPPQSGSGVHNVPPRGGVPVPAPDGLSGFRPPAPRFSHKPLHANPSQRAQEAPRGRFVSSEVSRSLRIENASRGHFCAFGEGFGRSGGWRRLAAAVSQACPPDAGRVIVPS